MRRTQPLTIVLANTVLVSGQQSYQSESPSTSTTLPLSQYSTPSVVTSDSTAQAPYTSTTAAPSTYQGTTSSGASICSGQTLNVPSASLNWWYGSTLYDAVATLSAEYNSDLSSTGWTVIPATTSFDLTTALASPSCTSSLVLDTLVGSSVYSVTCASTATPVAAHTTVITQTAYQSPTASQGPGPAPSVVATPPPAAISIGNGAFGAATPFVYFSEYDIITKTPVTQNNGAVDCSTITSTYPMASPFSFEYTGANPDGASYATAGVTGPVNPDVLPVVDATQAKAGEWLAAPTVAIIVQEVFAASLSPRQGPMTQISASQLQTIIPTFPSFLTPLGPPPTQHPFGPPPPPQQQTSAPSLQVPSFPWTTAIPSPTVVATTTPLETPTVIPTEPSVATTILPTEPPVTTASVTTYAVGPETTSELPLPTTVPYSLASGSAISLSAALAALGVWTVVWL